MSKRGSASCVNLAPSSYDTKGEVMASICKERTIEATPEAVWGALRDWGALHERLVPGFVVDT